MTPLGRTHVRRRTFRSDDWLGDTAFAPARRADFEQLSLLALDPTVRSCDPACALYLDIETAGIRAGAGKVAFLIGLAFFEGEDLVLEQLLLGDENEEAATLATLAERIGRASVIVTFNGKSFDLPVLRARKKNVPGVELPDMRHLDLLALARRIHRGRFADCRLASIEREVLAFERTDDVEPSQIGACYLHFLRTSDAEPLRAVVQHNEWDVLSMVALLGVYGEPLASTRLSGGELVGVARTLKRAGALDIAAAAADRATATGEPSGRKVRAEVAKARGERAEALANYEAYAATVADPSVRLELAKLYEHFTKQHELAIAVVSEGTAEDDAAASRRLSRLQAKVARKNSVPPAKG